jgi:hypothetical protein
VPPGLARPRPPSGNGHGEATPPVGPAPLHMRRSAWVDPDLDEAPPTQKVWRAREFSRLLDPVFDKEVRIGGTPSAAVLIGVAIVVAIVVLAVAIYRLAPP